MSQPSLAMQSTAQDDGRRHEDRMSRGAADRRSPKLDADLSSDGEARRLIGVIRRTLDGLPE